jgi:cytochrome b involved in lipid metabolism
MYQEKLIVYLGNRVYDITGYIHPGGVWILHEMNCNHEFLHFSDALVREVSRYLLGTSGVDSCNSTT